MEEVVVPHGKQLRFRCNVPKCTSLKTFSIISVMDHLALHFAEKERKSVFNYYCNLCRINFYVLGMCAGCKCQARDPKSFVQLKPTIKRSDIDSEIQFFHYVSKHVVPVFDNMAGPNEKSRPPSNPGTSDTVAKNQEDRQDRRSEETTNSHECGERRSRSTVRRQPHDSRQNNVPTKRPVPPPIPRRPASRSPAPRPQNSSHSHKREEEEGSSRGERRSRSTYRRPPVKSRQDGLLTENPPPPSVSKRQMSRSPGPRSRVTMSRSPGPRSRVMSVESESANGFPTPGGIISCCSVFDAFCERETTPPLLSSADLMISEALLLITTYCLALGVLEVPV
ncbi:hypothetical protein Y032_0055g2602 [Ancylostoma ceylanicum]|uniref:Uncharacterized protein n=1 Tax=Ancylostoma ceylanicum TaxID=53326 RepID=A0A016U6R6_9BILA|nr:hypothetical protein Y032_0055g2602 [Ancylostoma ceylanicum]